MIFHLPERDASSSPDEQPSVSSQSEETRTDPSVESEPSPERLRTDEPSTTTSAAFHQSFSQLVTSQCLPLDSVLMDMESPAAQDVERTAESLSDLTVCDEASQPEAGEANISVPFDDFHAQELQSEQRLNLRNAVPASDMILVRFMMLFMLQRFNYVICGIYCFLHLVYFFFKLVSRCQSGSCQ